jgi:low affinity Fe/Cu permease
MKKTSFFEKAATKITSWAGSATALCMAIATVLIWAVSGPLFGYSDTWQLAINTGTTIITFLMVFIIQKSQNKDSKAIQLKLNELIAANRYTSNRMVDIEDLTEVELDTLHKYYKRLSDNAEADEDIHQSHSIDDANDLHKEKSKRLARKRS